jgi:hypothetical protein
MAATCSSEISVDFQWTTWHYVQEDRSFNNHYCENLKFCIKIHISLAYVKSNCYEFYHFVMYVSFCCTPFA